MAEMAEMAEVSQAMPSISRPAGASLATATATPGAASHADAR
jgi:hypothetical protein